MSGTSFDNYYVQLRNLLSTCNYGALRDELGRDRIVCGICDEDVRKKKLFEEAELTLDRCLDCCKAAEASKKQMKNMSVSNESVHAVSGRPKGKKKLSKKNTNRSPATNKPHRVWKPCNFCGNKHEFKKSECPTWGKSCNLCQGKNHFSKMCRQNKAHEVDYEEYNSSSSYEEHSTCKILANMQLRGNPPTDITMQVDCGATYNVIPERYRPPDCTITSTNMRLSLYNKKYMEIKGICKLHLRNKKTKKKYLVHFAVVTGQMSMPLIGSTNGLIKIQYANIERPKSDGKQTSAPRANL